jgi:23S rRNA (guanosine2251-2'-O)-methyltransferase
MTNEITYIYGKHAVKEALLARPDVVRVVHIAEATIDTEMSALITRTKISRKTFNPKKLPTGVARDAVHQGIIAEIDTSKLLVDFVDFLRSHKITNDTALAILGEVQDPHNVGAVIRSAAAFGITAVLIPEHRQAQVTGTVIKVSVGTAFRVPLVNIGNVNQTIADLKDKGFWIYGLDGEAEHSITTETFERPSAFILGNEATGIRQKTLEHCDIALRIPMSSSAESLNASVAAAVVFYAWSTHHPKVVGK